MGYFEPKSLLKKSPPTRRASYSDRTAWLMAEMSKLAYLRFESPTEHLENVTEKLSQINDKDKIQKILKNFLKQQASIEDEGVKVLENELSRAGFELIRAFNRGGTQAFLAKRDKDKMAVLSFRGTEATQLADIKTDLNAIITNDSGQKIHTGFREAFGQVKSAIKKEVSQLSDYAIYITGHSLGGALALIATRELGSDNTASCYTFGSPRVGGSEFADSIKTPIYRIVNTADVVPRLPPGIFIEVIVDLLRTLKGVLPFLEFIATWLDDKVSGYRHHGDMRYLTNCKSTSCSDVRLISNITFLARWKRLLKNRVSFNRHIKDHSISEYCKKLAAYAKHN